MTDATTTPSEQFRVVELFAGVGGFALGLSKRLDEKAPFTDEGWQWTQDGSWRVTWASQWEPATRRQHAADAYRARLSAHGDVLVDADIHAVLNYWLGEEQDDEVLAAHAREHRVPARSANPDEVVARLVAGWKSKPLPDAFELLVGGFPCQDYSVAKSLSQSQGLVGKKGVLWWEIERIIASRRPPHIILENVDRLLASPATARGRDFATMLATLAFHGYDVEWRVIDASQYGFPQRRRRVFIYATNAGGYSSPEDAIGNGLMATAFPATLEHTVETTDFGLPAGVENGGSESLRGVLLALEGSWSPTHDRPWGNAGAMVDGAVVGARVAVVDEAGTRDDIPHRLGTIGKANPGVHDGVALPLVAIVKDANLNDYLIPAEQLGLDVYRNSPIENATPEQRATWGYHKGTKREIRHRRDGSGSYTYSEGAIAFPDRLENPSRTIVTGEGGPSVSRFKHVIAQEVEPALTDHPVLSRSLVNCESDDSGACATCGGRDTGIHAFRRLTPLELERLNMFADGWTAPIESDSRRAFVMGNALVVGVVARLGEVLHERIQNRSLQTSTRPAEQS